MKQLQVMVSERRTLGPALWQIQVTAPDMVKTTRPGQFYLAAGPTALRRPLFPARLGPGDLSFLVKAGPDPFVAWLASRAPGDSLDLIGPLGRGFDAPTSGQHLLLVAETAVDAGPLLPLMDGASVITLLTGATQTTTVFPPRELPPAVELRVATADGSLGQRGDVASLLSDTLPWADRVCAVGSRQLYRALGAAIEETRPGPLSRFAQVLLTDVPFVCGVGACLACAVAGQRHPRLACVEGPVFDLNDLAQELAQ